MSTVAERKAKIEKLKREREQKELERKQREADANKKKASLTAEEDLIQKIFHA